MKRTLLLLTCVVVLTFGASAQERLTFADLPLVSSPSPMPSGYGHLDWGNFSYVDPYEWSGSGPGFKLGPIGQDIAFIDGRFCGISPVCYGTLNLPRGFALVSADVAGGFGPTTVTLVAYRNGTHIGTANFFVTSQMRTLSFPPSWGVVTEVVLQVSGGAGGLVVYSLTVYTLGG